MAAQIKAYIRNTDASFYRNVLLKQLISWTGVFNQDKLGAMAPFEFGFFKPFAIYRGLKK